MNEKQRADPKPTRRTGLTRRLVRWAVRLVAIPLAAVLAYIAAATIGALVQSAEVGGPEGEPVTIYVASNGFHADIVVPFETPAKSWGGLLQASPITSELVAGTRWIAFGWGSEVAYTRLGEITDLTPDIMVRALAFDRSVVHVAPLADISSGDGVWLIQVSGTGYRRLVSVIEDSFALDAAGRPILLDGITHGYGDSFFRGRRRFSLFRSCNVWVGEALRAAGIRAGIWTPFAQSLNWASGLQAR
jgi:uncharacterized protein (TIGR02117 family)